MCNWGQAPFAHAKVSDYSKTIHVQKGPDPNCTLHEFSRYEKVFITVITDSSTGKLSE